jgi:hypothetical protein
VPTIKLAPFTGMSAVAASVLLLAAAGCGESAEVPPSGPSLLAIQESKIGIGQAMTFVGADFFPTPDSRTDIRFDGQFVAADGTVEPVRGLRIKPHRQDANTLVWPNFGPFANPFSAAGNRIGTFTGTVTAITGAKDGAPARPEVESRPLLVDLAIEPSLVITQLRPRENATCGGPVKRVLGAFTYTITVEAVGFTPVNFTFAISGEPGLEQPRIYRMPAAGKQSVTFGADPSLFFFRPVPLDLAFYVATLDVSALGSDGQTRFARYNFGVHNPIEYITTGPAQTAEYYVPQQVSPCYGGGVNGTMQSWTETTEETSTRQVGTHWDQSWLTSHSVSTTHATTNQVTIAVSDSSTNGWQSGWNTSVAATHEEGAMSGWNAGEHNDTNSSDSWGVMAGVSVPFVSAGGSYNSTKGVEHGTSFGTNGSYASQDSVTGSYGENFEANHSNTHSVTVGHDYSTTDTEGWSYEQSQTVAKGGDSFWQVSSAMTSSHEMSVQVLPGQYAMVYRQRVRQAYPAMIVAYDLCGESQVIASASFTDWTWNFLAEQGSSCPPPPVHMPAPACFLDCGGQ